LSQTQAIALYQPLLHQIAYNLLRCKADAEDVVQDTFLRWFSIDQSKVENPKAYLISAEPPECPETQKRRVLGFHSTVRIGGKIQRI
jgi:RNA polymerase sigma-70 factor (ECF subfamily)